MYFETFSVVFTLFRSLFTHGLYGESVGVGAFGSVTRGKLNHVINQSSACKVQRAVSAHINCTCALRSLERKHRHSLYIYSSRFSIVTIRYFSVCCMSYVDKLWSHFLFHQRCARRNPPPQCRHGHSPRDRLTPVQVVDSVVLQELCFNRSYSVALGTNPE